ncbi:MAG: glycosyl hydrolase 53 family protein [Bacteroidales bacterium]|nr:glycosyl hydrolase 53 family protein [Candidatus Liminaster caballi]
MKNSISFVLTALMTLGTAAMADTNIVAGGDLSLVPAYEKAGHVWLDADNKPINTTYTDGMITYVKEVAGWNAVRVRLFVDPTKDSDLGTCQDIEYVKALGARIKAAGLQFLLDIHYSDTWADPTSQKIPSSWGFTTSTSNDVVAAKVYEYTNDVLQTLKSANATPDFVQIGNETSYGLLLRSNSDKVYPAQAYSNCEAAWKRLAQLIGQGSKAVREQCPAAKIIIHIERTATASQCTNYFSYLRQAGLSDDAYDIIGLSYYPFWHGKLSQLEATVSDLGSKFPQKEVQLVEIGWNCNEYYPSDATYAASTFPTWPTSPAGQAQMLKDIVAMLKQHSNATGIYYWCPEECGNGETTGGTNQVMGGWLNRGFWELKWLAQQHKLTSPDALMTIKTMLPEGSDINGVISSVDAEAPIYDILGRKVSKPVSGQIYIRNGRKVIF